MSNQASSSRTSIDKKEEQCKEDTFEQLTKEAEQLIQSSIYHGVKVPKRKAIVMPRSDDVEMDAALKRLKKEISKMSQRTGRRVWGLKYYVDPVPTRAWSPVTSPNFRNQSPIVMYRHHATGMLKKENEFYDLSKKAEDLVETSIRLGVNVPTREAVCMPRNNEEEMDAATKRMKREIDKMSHRTGRITWKTKRDHVDGSSGSDMSDEEPQPMIKTLPSYYFVDPVNWPPNRMAEPLRCPSWQPANRVLGPIVEPTPLVKKENIFCKLALEAQRLVDASVRNNKRVPRRRALEMPRNTETLADAAIERMKKEIHKMFRRTGPTLYGVEHMGWSSGSDMSDEDIKPIITGAPKDEGS